MRYLMALLVFLCSTTFLTAETPDNTSGVEGSGVVLRFPRPEVTAKPRFDGLTWALLAADGGARALDAYSTRRMLRNNCNASAPMPGTSTCNYEQTLPGFITNRATTVYAFEGAVWGSEFLATRFLVRHHHARLAKFIPLIDTLSTTSFAINNLTLSIGHGETAAMPAAAQIQIVGRHRVR
jgi:hypothetical protein